MHKYAIIVAGGSGLRMGAALPKQFLLLHNKPVLWYSINAFFEAFDDITIILVLPEIHLDRGSSLIQSTARPAQVILTHGGDTRFQSVKNALELVDPSGIVLIHDGVRCLVTPDLIQRCYQSASEHGNAIPAIPAVDTLRILTPAGNEMLDRSEVRIIQTPQAFRCDLVMSAYMQPFQASFTDDSSVVESSGHRINLVDGEVTNIKITNPVDLLIAEKILDDRMPASEAGIKPPSTFQPFE
jgi:2-C-methyl-D-erythritol 4-phosphate cytidylyltransferase